MTNSNSGKPNLALLIDADNISAKYLPIILNEIPRYGVTTYRRIYGDFTDPQAASWRQKLLDNNITPIQQFSNVKSHKKGEKAGKNATDSTLIIDAMDILYAGKVDGFVIVSSDSDFTRLASRLRESNMLVVGMGRNQTAISFRHACTKFVNIEALYKMETDKAEEQSARSTAADGEIETTVTLQDVEKVVAGIIRDDENKGREETSLAVIGASLNDKFPDFDVRNFGYSQLYKLIEELGPFELVKVENGYNVKITANTSENDEILAFMCAEIGKSADGKAGIASLATKVYRRFPSFDLKNAGYSQFYKFADSFDALTIEGDGSHKLVTLTRPDGADAHDASPAEEQSSAQEAIADTTADDEGSAAPKSAEAPKRTRKRRSRKAADKNAQADAADASNAQSAEDAQATEQAADTSAQQAPTTANDTTPTASSASAPTKKEVFAFAESQLQHAKDNTMGISQLAAKVRKRFTGFDLAALGYKQFYQLIDSSKNMKAVGEGRSRKATLK